MRRGSLFWGVIIIIAGVLLLLGNLGLLAINVWQLIWPLFLVLLGVWFLLGPRMSRRTMQTQQLSIPQENTRQANIQVRHGAGRLDLSTPSPMGQLVTGSFGGGVDYDVRRDGDRAQVKLSAPPMVYPFGFWSGPDMGYMWQIGFSPDVDINLDLDTGASESHLDFSGLRLSSLRLTTGASSTDMTLPGQAGFTRVEIHAGAASVNLRVPQGVAARIHVQTGLFGVNIDTARFSKLDNNLYQSPDYDTASNRAEINVEAGVGSIDIR